MHSFNKKYQTFRTEVLRQEEIGKGGRASQTSVFSLNFHALSNDSYNNPEKLSVPEMKSGKFSPRRDPLCSIQSDAEILNCKKVHDEGGKIGTKITPN